MTTGFATLVKVALAAVVGGAIAMHLFAPDLMRSLGHVIHGGH